MADNVLILSGGGAKAAFQAGVIEKLHRQGWQPDAVAGVSAGALNAVMVGTGQALNLTAVWRDITESKVFKKRGNLRTAGDFLLHKLGISRPWLGYYDNSPLRQLIRDSVGTQFTMDFYCGTVDIERGHYHEHRARPGMVPYNYIEKVLASTAIPVIFDPVWFRKDKALHVDGGLRHMNPIGQVLRDHNPKETVIITCTPRGKYMNQDVKDITSMAKNTLDILLSEIFEKDLRQFHRLNQIVRQAREQRVSILNKNGDRYIDYKATLYEPTESLGDSLNFSSKQAVENIARGIAAKGVDI